MRLHSVKISGFKSFANPVTIRMDVPLLCIVGPNGSGKSNIVEAITWVMGESRASVMRGESMQNVIFNGTAVRKPMDWCSVEMRIDNSEDTGADLKAWSNYPELVVKRELERDGDSTYRINSQVVRRRDVNDLFSGTGLGAHGYSVVHQGMVAQIVEDNPAHIRIYLEEAAGVSMYKSRRRETESALRRAEENLGVLESQRMEIDAQVATLKRQASAALRHREFEAEIEQLRLVALELQRREIDAELARLSDERRRRAEVEQGLARDREQAGREIGRLEDRHAKLVKEHDAVQSEHFRQQGVVAGMDRDLKNLREKRAEAEAEAARRRQEQESLQTRLAGQKAERDGHAETAARAAEEIRRLDGEIAEAGNRAAELQSGAESSKESHGEIVREGIRRGHLLEAKGMQIEVQKGTVKQTGELLAALADQLADLAKQLAGRDQALRELKDACRATENLRRKRDDAEDRLRKRRGQLADIEAQVAGLRTDEVRIGAERELLMSVESGLGGDVQAWIREHGIAAEQELSRQVRIDAGGWESAFDAALDARLNAFLVDDPHGYADRARMPAGVELIARAPSSRGDRGRGGEGREPLAAKIECSPEWKGLLETLLDGFYAAESAAAARTATAALGLGEWMVTPEGEMYGRDSVRALPKARRGYGWQARIERLNREGERVAKRIGELEGKAGRRRSECGELERKLAGIAGELEAADKAEREAERKAAAVEALSKSGIARRKELDAQEKAHRAELGKAGTRLAELESESEGIRKWLAEHRLEIEESKREQGAAAAAIEQAEIRRKELEASRAAKESEYNRAAGDAKVAEAHIENTKRRIGEFEQEIAALRRRLEGLDESGIAAALAKARDKEAKIDGKRQAARKLVDELAARISEHRDRLREIEERREKAHDRVRDADAEEGTLRERISTVDKEIKGVQAEMDDELRAKYADRAAAEERMRALEAKRARLGEINFAAESELKEASERAGELESQLDDVRRAIEDEQQAIARIDREMRERLGKVFGSVSEKFGELFRKAFGGGSASLELDGESLLDAGVKIRATPPGKSIDRLHLLSGGEKSLVALAFILAIFSLNPAPFCVMDEVDAALDDHNTAMFNNLIREFSDQVQFIVVTHNKLTADIAHRLLGVAQPEKGVSSLVTVKVSDVERFVETGVAA